MADIDFDDFDQDYPVTRSAAPSRWVNVIGATCSVALVLGLVVWGYKLAVRDVNGVPVVRALEGFRRATNALHDISFDTICGSGPNGAIMHYRVTEESNRQLGRNELLLVDSGAQYLDGTTDITRTMAIGDPGDYARACYTRVLQGVIAISRARWPKGLAGQIGRAHV